MIGDGAFAGSLAKTLAGHGVDVERAGLAAAATTADVLLPDLIVLAADAAQGRGAAVIAQLQAAGRVSPTLVISAAEAGGLVPVQPQAHVGHITPAGGVLDCAVRVRALLHALLADPSAGANVQKLADRVASRAGKPTPSTAAPARTSPGFPSPLSASGSKDTSAAATRAGPATRIAATDQSKVTRPLTNRPLDPGKAAKPSIEPGQRKRDARPGAVPNAGNEPAQNKPAQPNKTDAAGSSGKRAGALTMEGVAPPHDAAHRKPAQPNKTDAPGKPGRTSRVADGKDATVPLRVSQPAAAASSKSRKPDEVQAAADRGTGLGKTPSLSAPGSAVKSSGPLTPPTTQADTSQRAANMQQVAGKPWVPNIGAASGVTGSAAMSGGGQSRTIRGLQSPFSPSGPGEAEQPTLRPTAPGPEEPVLQGAQTKRPARSPNQSPANDQARPPEAEKTAPRIPLRAKRAATSTGDAARTGQPDPTVKARATPSAAASGGAQPDLHEALRASELEFAISMSDPPPERSESPQRHAEAKAQKMTAPQTLAAQRKQAPPMPTSAGTPQARLSEADARQLSDSEVDIMLSDRPPGAAPKLLPADTTPPPAKNNTAPAAPTADAQRTTGAIAPSVPAHAPRKPLPPRTNEQATRTTGAVAQTNAARLTGAVAPSMPAHAARNPPEPAPRTNDQATRTTGAIAPSMPAHAPRSPLEPAARANQQATRTTGAIAPSMPAHAPRNPLDPAPQTNDQATRTTGSITQSMPPIARNPLDPAPRTNDQATRTTGSITQSMPPIARNPLDPAPRTNDQATRTTGAIAQSMPARAPRYPFDPAPRAVAPTSGADVPRMTSGAPRHPFDPAPRPIDPAHTTGSLPRMPSGAPRHPFDPAPSTSIRIMSSGAPRYPSEPSVGQSGAPAGAPRAPLAPAGRPPSAASQPSAAFDASPAEPASRAFDAPQGMPDIDLSPSKPRRWRGAWVLGAAAAIGCSALWLYQTYDRSAATAPGNAATGALVQAPALEPLPVDHAAPPALAPQATASEPVQAAEPSAPSASAERRAGTPRRTGESQEADPTTAAGRARALVDSGSAMLRQRRYGIAEGMYMKALQEVPEYPPAMAELVRVHLARKDGKEAVRWAELLVAKQSSGLHQLLLGDAQALRGNRGAAEAAWTKAAKAGNATAQQRLADDEEEEE